MNDTKIYAYPLEYAKETGELEAYWGSAKVNRECAAAIDKAISASHYDQYYYNLPDALAAVTKEYGLDRVAWVVAAVIQANESDRRYSRVNREWAQDCSISHEKPQNFFLQSHPTVLDGFADKVRAVRFRALAQTAAVEMSVEQNCNMLDGIVNNERPRVNQNYTVIDSETIGNQEIVLAQNPKAVQAFVTWQRNISNDEQSGQENFFWGHYFSDPNEAQKDFKNRVQEQREDFQEQRLSIRSQLKAGAARTDTLKAPTLEHKKDAPER